MTRLSFISLFIACCLCHFTLTSIAQDRFDLLEKELNELAIRQAGLNGTVEFSVSGISVTEFIRGVAAAHGLNVSVSPKITGNVVNNFSDARVADVLVFLCREYRLDIQVVGNILSFHPYVPPPIEPEPLPVDSPDVHYAGATDFLSLDLKRDTLDKVAEAITRESFKNVVLSPAAKGKIVSVFIQNRPFDNALEKMAYANGLTIEKTDDRFYLVDVADAPESPTFQPGRKTSGKRVTKNTSGYLDVKALSNGRLTVHAEQVAITDLLAVVSDEVQANYFLFNAPKGSTSLFMENATYEDFLHYLLHGTDFTYKRQNKVYLIGQRNQEGLRTTELIQLQNRTVESVIDFIPADLKQGVDIKEFIELNGLILSGSHPRIEEIKSFVRAIDQVVPVVIIEVLIVDVNKTKSINAGVQAGVGTNSNGASSTGGTLSPGVQFDFTSESVNRLIGAFNGLGIVNLGNVTPDFYLSIQALESNGRLRVRSTPQLSTLNGHEANLRIGKTEYYLEVNNNVIGTQNPQNIISQTYRSTSADLSITIKPIVSGNEHVTLEISVEQSDFTGRISENAPPGTVSRNFKSTIRVRNKDMILLGGLEENSTNNSGSGLPFLSRVPVLKWLTGTRTKEESKSKLDIFIKPTIIF